MNAGSHFPYSFLLLVHEQCHPRAASQVKMPTSRKPSHNQIIRNRLPCPCPSILKVGFYLPVWLSDSFTLFKKPVSWGAAMLRNIYTFPFRKDLFLSVCPHSVLCRMQICHGWLGFGSNSENQEGGWHPHSTQQNDREKVEGGESGWVLQGAKVEKKWNISDKEDSLQACFFPPIWFILTGCFAGALSEIHWQACQCECVPSRGWLW